MRKITYNIIGSNNFWYGSCITTKKEAITEAKNIISSKNDTYYADPETGHTPEKPETIYVYKSEEIAQF